MLPVDVQFVVGLSGYFVKDLAAVRHSPSYNPLTDTAIRPRTSGFKSVVQPGQVISIILHLPNGSTAIGDCADVIFSGAASRDPLFIAEDNLPILHTVVKKWLLSCDLSQFRPNAEYLSSTWPQLNNRKLHSALRYGLSQALLAATAQVYSCTIAEIISREWGTHIAKHPVDILASCHRNDTLQLDRMIMKQVDLLPHASFVHVSDIGSNGAVLLEYIAFVARRVKERKAVGYTPRLHFDVYGTVGDIFTNTDQLVEFFGMVQRAAEPYEVLIESPIIANTKEEQIRRLAELRGLLRSKDVKVKTVADEWCNTLEDIKEFACAGAVDYVQIKMPDLGGVDKSIDAVIYCKSKGVGCCLGGSANETDVSARITAQVALAVRPDFLLSKPGIGADEGLMILRNEMLRGVALAGRAKTWCRL
ncbi:hypothetical protein H072_8639 [Dactylellina haptotyla CBS 200.50]|uniref:methylaspartate ammonia-lyase n=1 Tax=Dactylellina haptotyla (strain CBS 200.50) TaxID=1284197 RepID=S8BQW5_DACHA|nr:hypothetical protein H072_8639 [Dactylellina haptotyla CBS 200.50]